MISEKEVQQQMEAGAGFAQTVTAVRYRAKTNQLEITTPWCVLLVDRKQVNELDNVSRRQLKEIYADESGIHIDSADIDIESTGLVLSFIQELVEVAQRARRA